MTIFIGKSLLLGCEATYKIFESQLVFQNEKPLFEEEDQNILSQASPCIQKTAATIFRILSQQYFHVAQQHIGCFLAEKLLLGETQQDAIIITTKKNFFIRDEIEDSNEPFNGHSFTIVMAGRLFDIIISVGEIAFAYAFAQFLTVPVALAVALPACVWIVADIAIALRKIYQTARHAGIIH